MAQNGLATKKKRIKLLKDLTEQALSSPLPTPFICPAIKKTGQISWMTGKNPAEAVLNCLNRLPPLFFFFRNTKGQGSLFSVNQTWEYMQEEGINFLIWIKTPLSLKFSEADPAFFLFWKELSAHLENIKEPPFPESMEIITLETEQNKAFSLYDFSELNTIIKTPVSLSTLKKIDRLTN